MALDHAARTRAADPHFGHGRMLFLVDNEAVVGALNKGRSSRYDLLRLCRRSLALCIAAGVIPRWRYVATAVNPADEPSRRPGRPRANSI